MQLWNKFLSIFLPFTFFFLVAIVYTVPLLEKMGNSKSAQTLNSAGEVATSIFQFEVPTIDGTTTMLSTQSGKKAYIVVNVASQWGLANQNYAELETLYKKYK